MAIQENVTNNNRMPTPDELGKMAELYAPNTPSNFVLAVLEQESQRGLNKASHTSRKVADSELGEPQSVLGPGQILDSPYSWQPRSANLGSQSLAAHFYNKTTGKKYQEGNLHHATIAALAKIDSDYLKANGDDLEFSKNYFGRGIDKASGGLAAEGYVVKLRSNLAKLGGIESVNNVPIQAKLETLTGANDPAVRQAGALAAEQRKADGANLIETMRRTGEDVINSLMGVNEAAINTINTAAADSVAVAGQKKDFMIKALGFDPTGDTNNITAAGKVLNKNLADLLNLQEGLANAKANPIFAILDGMSDGKVSKQFVAEIEQRQKVATDISQSINQLHTLAKEASNIGMATVSQMSEASRLASIRTLNAKHAYDVAVASGKTDIEAAKADIKTAADIKNLNDANERNIRQAEQDELRKARSTLSLQQQAFTLAQQQGQSDTLLAIKQKQLEKLELDIEGKQTKAAENLAKSAAKDKLASAMGTTAAELDLALKNKDPVITELITNPKSLGALEYKASKGSLSLDEKTARNLAFGTNGWASKSKTAGIEQGLLTEALKDKEFLKLKPEARKIYLGNKLAATLGEQRNTIVNTKDTEDSERNLYAANHGLLLSKNATLLEPVLLKSVELSNLAKTVFTSKLYTDIQTEMAANRKFTGDEDILNMAVKLVKIGGASSYSITQAAEEVSNYFMLAAKTNNVAKNYAAVGVPEQENYQVNLTGADTGAANKFYAGNTADWRTNITMPILKINDRNPNSVNNYSVDLANSDGVKLLLIRMAIPQRGN